MIRFFKAICSLLIALTAILACDVLEEPYVIEDIEVDFTRFPVPEFPDKTTYVKKVFLEEYTGHKCGNCPRGHEEVVRLEEIYQEQLITLAVHITDFFAGADESGPYTSDYRTPTGNDLDDYFGVGSAGLPRGLVNRAEYNSLMLLAYANWEGAIERQLSTAPLLDLQIITQFDADSNDFAAHIQIHLLQDFQHTLHLSVFMVEDSIVSAQKDYNEDPTVIEDYTHRHMLRGSLNGTWGDPLFEGSAANGQKIIKSYSAPLPEKYDPLNCAIIAFVYDALTMEVLQVEEVKIIRE